MGSWSKIYSSIILVLIFVIIAQFAVSAVHWVPIVDRSTDEAADPIEAAFQKTNQLDQIHKEKVQRISKMLNNSLDLQEQELKEGNRKLEDLRHTANLSPNSIRIEASIIITFILCYRFL